MSDDLIRPSGLGTTFKRLLRKIVVPNNAVTGEMRWEIGADTPPELQAYGIGHALIARVTSKATGLETGYFFIGVSNSMDSGADDEALVYGNVTYPVPGDPSSAGVGNVKTNFQQNRWGQFQSTIFKDHTPTVWEKAWASAAAGLVTSFQASRFGDTHPRFRFDNSGKEEWGTGAAAPDTNLYRTSAGVLKTDGDLNVNGVLISSLAARVQSGVQLVSSAGAQNAFTVVNINFPTAFAAAPRMAVGINSGAAITQFWQVQTFNVSATQFSLWLYANDGGADTLTNIPVHWIAVAP